MARLKEYLQRQGGRRREICHLGQVGDGRTRRGRFDSVAFGAPGFANARPDAALPPASWARAGAIASVIPSETVSTIIARMTGFPSRSLVHFVGIVLTYRPGPAASVQPEPSTAFTVGFISPPAEGSQTP